ncbi:hypothetical protein N780_08670 [Pontibacillus chungwhensis BH030062]|uniref:Uncharacterized protein n=1 Tax=Pontibacillus chungwhensis BH030062 TaxID=1385513 RepID=A0A0A2UXV0_9BACI|nr:hypothetical protein [Pontibacillus chungwhensis]KGP91326.1 hypothetical protein N780_08670 [Pontibacillus chungwhensis BH030062]
MKDEVFSNQSIINDLHMEENLEKVLTADFLTQQSQYNNFEEFKYYFPFHISELQIPYKNFQGAVLDNHISDTTDFDNWEEFIYAATQTYYLY